MPLIEAAHRAFGASVDVWAIGQDAAGNAKLVERFALTAPMLDDSALKVSFEYDLDTVPTIILADAHGREQRRFVGFGRDDWREMFAELSRLSGNRRRRPSIGIRIRSRGRDAVPNRSSRESRSGSKRRRAATS